MLLRMCLHVCVRMCIGIKPRTIHWTKQFYGHRPEWEASANFVKQMRLYAYYTCHRHELNEHIQQQYTAHTTHIDGEWHEVTRMKCIRRQTHTTTKINVFISAVQIETRRWRDAFCPCLSIFSIHIPKSEIYTIFVRLFHTTKKFWFDSHFILLVDLWCFQYIFLRGYV